MWFVAKDYASECVRDVLRLFVGIHKSGSVSTGIVVKNGRYSMDLHQSLVES